jgi:adenine-specific DNA-methyltransferase
MAKDRTTYGGTVTMPDSDNTIEFSPINALTGPGEARDNVELLARLFPDAIRDGRVDFESLRDLLGDDAQPAGAETSGLRWVGMAEARQLSTLPATGTLLPRPDESVEWDTTRNVVVEGDNLEVLRLLRRGYTNKVDVVYIDPPYNTGNDFVYDDKRTSSIVEHESAAGLRDEGGATQSGEASGRAEDRRLASAKHAKWLSMMYPRLLVAHSLLKETGVMIVAIDDTEHSRLKLLLDRVFGAENFAANVVWQGSGKNDARFGAGGLDYMLIYTKSRASLIEADVRWTEPKVGLERVLALAADAWEASGSVPEQATKIFRKNVRSIRDELEPAVFRYDQIDSVGRVFQSTDASSPNPRPNLMYEIVHPLTGKPVRMPENGWRYARDAMSDHISQGRIIFGPDENTTPRFKRYLDEMDSTAIRPVVNLGRISSSYALNKLLGSDIFPYSKDTSVLARWIHSVSQGKKDALVVDFFAGSGSTGHAVMDLNAVDGGTRRYMLVQLDETVNKDGYATIADITRERLRRAGKQIAGDASVAPTEGDRGFRSYRLASSNLRPWDGTGELSLLDSVDNLVEGRSTDDLLVETMLRLGIELTTPVETRQVANSTLYSLGGGTLYAFFGENVTTKQSIQVGRALIKWRDELPVESDVTIVVRDTGFTDSSAKLNLEAAVKQAGFTTFRSI